MWKIFVGFLPVELYVWPTNVQVEMGENLISLVSLHPILYKHHNNYQGQVKHKMPYNDDGNVADTWLN